MISATGGTDDYNDLENKPIILSRGDSEPHSETLVGELYFPDLIMAGYDDSGHYRKTYCISDLSGYALKSNSLPFSAFRDQLKKELFKNYNLYDNPPSDLFTNYAKAPTENGIWEINTGNLQGLPVPVAGKFINYYVSGERIQIYATNVFLPGDLNYQYSNRYFIRTQRMGDLGNWIEIGGGSQIVSGVVNQNGTITFTDSDGNTFTTTGASVIGPQGPQGAQGATGPQGPKGDPGYLVFEIKNGCLILNENTKDMTFEMQML